MSTIDALKATRDQVRRLDAQWETEDRMTEILLASSMSAAVLELSAGGKQAESIRPFEDTVAAHAVKIARSTAREFLLDQIKRADARAAAARVTSMQSAAPTEELPMVMETVA